MEIQNRKGAKTLKGNKLKNVIKGKNNKKTIISNLFIRVRMTASVMYNSGQKQMF